MESNYASIFEQDLGAYKSAVNRGDFELANTFGNRIMSNAYLFNEKEVGIIGFVLKEIAREGMIAKQVKDKSSTASNAVTTQAQTTIKKIEEQIKTKKLDLAEVWKIYSNLLVTTRKSKLTQDENTAYTNLNPEFTKHACEIIIKEFSNNVDLLKYPSNNLIGGILTEVSRIADCHGIENKSLQVISLFAMLARIYDYIRLTANEDLEKRVQEEFLPQVEKVLSFMKSVKDSDQSIVINDVLWELIKVWRLYFIKFTEIRANVPSLRRSALKEQTKSKIADALSKSLEKEISGEE